MPEFWWIWLLCAVGGAFLLLCAVVLVRTLLFRPKTTGQAEDGTPVCFDKDAAVALIASKLEPLVGKIPGLRHMEVRRCYAGMDYALYSEFDTAEDVKNYRAHPLHQEAKSHFHHFLDTRVSADYEV